MPKIEKMAVIGLEQGRFKPRMMRKCAILHIEENIMKKFILIVFFAAVAFSVAAVTPKTPTRDSDGYYLISSAEELWGLAEMVNKRFLRDSSDKFFAKLVKDIVVNENVLNDRDTLSKDTSAFECWPSMGTSRLVPYNGSFDGQGHSISGLVERDGGGLFRNFGTGTVKNLIIKDSYFFGSSDMGALMSTAFKANIENVTVQATVVSLAGDGVGGIVGNAGYGTIKDCVFKGYVSATDAASYNIGGIAGYAKLLFVNCENQGRVEGYSDVGGIVGVSRGVVMGCRNTGVVKGVESVGGVAGVNSDRLAFCSNEGPVIALEKKSKEMGGVVGVNSGTVVGLSNKADVQGVVTVGGVVGESTTLVSGCYNTGSVTGSQHVGGILGSGAGSMRGSYHGVSSSFNIGVVKGNSYVGALVGNKSKITNSFALASTAATLVGDEDGKGDTLGGEFASSGAFTDGTVLKVLDAKKGSATWVQGKKYPELQPVSNPEKKANYYEISNASEFLWFSFAVHGGATNQNTKAVLTDDIVFHKDLVNSVKALDSIRPNYEEWQPIYNETTKYGDGYEGYFDGQGHNIYGLYIYYTKEYGDSIGLFRFVEHTADIRNVGVEDSYFRGQRAVGGITAVNNGRIVNAHFSGYIRGTAYLGGIAGRGDYIYNTIRDSHNEGEIAGGSSVGGIVGSSSGTVSRCYNIGAVKGSTAGGIASSVGFVSNSYNWGPVKVSDPGGGIASSKTSKIVNSYNVGEVIESDKVTYRLSLSDSLGNNNYVLKNATGEESVAGENTKEKTAEEFADGSVVDLLNAKCSYNMWVQGEKYPLLEKPAKPAMEGDTFLISNASELYWFMEYVNDSLSNSLTRAKLVDDIVLKSHWTPIGYMNSRGFRGEFNGQGHSISGVNVFEDDSSRMVVGFFSKLSETALVKNLVIKNASVKGGRFVAGGIVGENFGRVENCVYEGSVTGRDGKSVGMIAGYDGGALFGNIGICTSNCDSIQVRADTVKYAFLNVNRKEVANFVIAASERDDKKFKDGSFVLEANDGIKDVVWKQGKDFPYLGVEIPEFKDNAYQIGNLGQLFWAFSYANIAYARPLSLTADIVVNKKVLKSDCAASGDACNFSNSAGFKKLRNAFDGNNHTISGLYGDFFIDSIYAGGSLKNLKIEDSYFNSAIFYNGGSVYNCSLDVKAGRKVARARGDYYTGALVAFNNGTIRDAEVKGSLVNKTSFVTAGVGGIVGRNDKNIINVRFNGVIETDSVVGGIVGYNQGVVDSTVFEGSVTGERIVGGIAGRSRSEILNSASNGVVSGSWYVGGIVGESYRMGNSVLKIRDCYNASVVEGEKFVGGLLGYTRFAGDSISDCFNIGTVIADDMKGGGLVGYMYSGAISYSFNYVTDKKHSSTGLLVDSLSPYENVIKNCYVFYDGEASLIRNGAGGRKFDDVAFKTTDEFADGTVLELLTKGRASYRWVQGDKYPVFGKMTVKPVEVPDDSLKFGFVEIARTPLFGMNVFSRNIQVFNAPVGSDFALLDMLGRVIARGYTELKDFEIHAPHAGSYLLKVGRFSRQVNVK